jgi:hypothetical protein
MPAKPDPPVESDEEHDEDVEVRKSARILNSPTSSGFADAAAAQLHEIRPSRHAVLNSACCCCCCCCHHCSALHPQYMLGYVDDPEKPTDLLRHRFPSKVGGVPVSVKP